MQIKIVTEFPETFPASFLIFESTDTLQSSKSKLGISKWPVLAVLPERGNSVWLLLK